MGHVSRNILVAGQLVAGTESTLVGPAGNSAVSVFPCGVLFVLPSLKPLKLERVEES